MTERYVGRIEFGASGTTSLDIDNLDAADWVGRPPASGSVVVLSAGQSDEWLVGVILLDGPRAWQYATATRIVTHDADGLAIEFRGLEPFAPITDVSQLDEGRAREEQRQRWHSRMRMMLPDQEVPPFDDVRLSVLERAARPGDEPPELMTHGRLQVEAGSARLALEHRGYRVWLARGREPDLISCIDRRSPDGGGGASFPRSTLTTHGACLTTGESHNDRGSEAHVIGVVDDRIIAVRVNGNHAVMGENVFVLPLERPEPVDVLTLTTAERDYELRFGPPPGL